MKIYDYVIWILVCVSAYSCLHKNEVKLTIASNTLKEIPDSIFLKKTLTILSITTEGFTLYPPLSASSELPGPIMPLLVIPEKIGNLVHLEKLQINGTHIKTLPKSITDLHELKELDLSRNYDLTIFNEIDKLSMLPSLNYLNIYGTNCSTTDLEFLKKRLGPKVEIIFPEIEFIEDMKKHAKLTVH